MSTVIRTQISLTEEQMRAARDEARRRRISLAGLIRLALDDLLRERDDAELRARAAANVGGFRSGTSGTSEDHDAVLASDPRW